MLRAYGVRISNFLNSKNEIQQLVILSFAIYRYFRKKSLQISSPSIFCVIFFLNNVQFLITLNSNTAKSCKYKKRYKELNLFKKIFNIPSSLHKNIRKLRLEIKVNWEKETNKQTTTTATIQPQPDINYNLFYL